MGNSRVEWALDTWAKHLPENFHVMFMSEEMQSQNSLAANHPWAYPQMQMPCDVSAYSWHENRTLGFIGALGNCIPYRFDWFVKVDDDTFVVPSKMKAFLSQYNSKEAIVVANAFVKEEKALSEKGNKCDTICGGPGYAMSQAAVKRVGQNMDILWANHNASCPYEDVVVDRTVRQLAMKVIPNEFFVHDDYWTTRTLEETLPKPVITIHPVRTKANFSELNTINSGGHTTLEDVQNGVGNGFCGFGLCTSFMVFILNRS